MKSMDGSLCLCWFQVHRRTWWLLAISLGGPVTHGGRCCDRGSFEPLGWSHLRIMPFGAWVLRLPSGCMRRNWCRDMHFSERYGHEHLKYGKVKQPAEESGTWSSVRDSGAFLFEVWSFD